jgi:hypothetical protein
MIKWAEAYQKTGELNEKVAAIDVTNEVDGGDSVISELKTIYGDSAIYQYHFCYHDDGKPCSTEPIQ